jgi:hypothetical protein
MSRFPAIPTTDWEDQAYQMGYRDGFNGVMFRVPQDLRGREKTLGAFVMGYADGVGDKAEIDKKLVNPSMDILQVPIFTDGPGGDPPDLPPPSRKIGEKRYWL